MTTLAAPRSLKTSVTSVYHARVDDKLYHCRLGRKIQGHKTEAVYRRYAIVCEADLAEGLKKVAAVEGVHRETIQPAGNDLSHSLATVGSQNHRITRENLAVDPVFS